MTKTELKSRLLSSSLLVLLAFFLLMGISFAWFSKNQEVRASGMGVSLHTSANLVISDSEDFSQSFMEVTMPSNTYRLLPASYSAASATGLQRPTDLSGVGYYSGLSGNPIVMEDVSSVDAGKYYIDYTVYISSLGQALENATLTAAITAPDPATVPLYHLAATVDFYLSAVSQENYKGSLNLAGLDREANHGKHNASAVKTELTLLSGSRIPCATDSTGEPYLKIIMRCYFDGALQNTDTTTYVTSAAINTARFTLDISFTADGTEANPN